MSYLLQAPSSLYFRVRSPISNRHESTLERQSMKSNVLWDDVTEGKLDACLTSALGKLTVSYRLHTEMVAKLRELHPRMWFPYVHWICACVGTWVNLDMMAKRRVLQHALKCSDRKQTLQLYSSSPIHTGLVFTVQLGPSPIVYHNWFGYDD